MAYNAKIHHEQGGSVLTVQSGGSVNLEAGGALKINAAQILSAASTSSPEAGNVLAAPGSFFLRVDGSMSNLYVNISDGISGSIWRGACIVNFP